MSKLIGKECKHVTWIRATSNNPDTHVIKVVNHYEDGTLEPIVHTMTNYPRSYFVTKSTARNHEQKKEYEHEDNLVRHTCTDSDMAAAVAKSLDMSWCKGGMMQLKKSVYLYGTDVSAAYTIKNKYNEKYGLHSDSTYAAIDIETNVLLPKKRVYHEGVWKMVDDEQIIIISLAFKNIMQVHVLASFVAGVDNPIKKMGEMTQKHLRKYIDEGLTYEYIIHKTEREMILKSVAQLHEWKPDFVGAHYGMSFDMPYIERRCEELRIDLADLWSDPSIPKNLRRYKRIPGKEKRTSAKGKDFVIPPPERWHIIETPASFVIVDSLCTYRALRMFAAKESYGLDALLKKETDTEKLKLDDTGAEGLQLHVVLQRDKPIEYCVYGGWDTYSMLLLDDVTKDMSMSLPSRMEAVEYKYVQSSSKKAGAFYHSYLRSKNCVLATAHTEEEDTRVLSGSGWINTVSPIT